MDISLFAALGPVMIGPSSSHTAGAARLARIAAQIVGQPFKRVRFGLHGSFAQTYLGHGTDKALVAGALGIPEDDERLAQSLELAAQQGLQYEFYHVELENSHENSVKITFYPQEGEEISICGSSTGGGQIIITRIDDFATEITARLPTLVIFQQDHPGVLGGVCTALAAAGINIATMRLSRNAKGQTACCVLETDQPAPDAAVTAVKAAPGVQQVQAIQRL